ncbi:MAG TPA: hypothetical protein PKC24_00210 [Cyclobacteriaceae bacterium]|nr:hypothetical protein [Cyclobacteriaceae bacterium]
MTKKILFGIDERLNNLENLKRYSKILNQEIKAKLIGVYLADFAHQPQAHNVSEDTMELSIDDEVKSTQAIELELQAHKLNIDYRYYRASSDHENLLINQSSFADLFVVDGIFVNDFLAPAENDCTLSLLSKMKCPVLLNADKFNQTDDIIIYFDMHESTIKAIKSFADLFNHIIKSSRTTSVFALSPESDEEIELEKNLMNYLIGTFKNVGIQMTDRYALEKDLGRHLTSAEKPLLISGKKGIDFICQTVIMKKIRDQFMPAFFA